MQRTIFDRETVERAARGLGIADIGRATIGQTLLLARTLEELSGVPMIRMDQGVPGLEPCRVGIEAEKAALERGVAFAYPPAEGIPELKEAASRFIEAFIGVQVSERCCVPSCGGVAASFAAFILTTQLEPGRDTVLFLDPGFPIQKAQLAILGVRHVRVDIHSLRGELLRGALEEFLKAGDVAAIVYSNPNNPAWICLGEDELEIIGQAATRHGAIVLEDLAYLCMDFRRDPSLPPLQPTVARYTDNYILMLSGSKIYSYAGQRVGVVAISDALYSRTYPALAARYGGEGHLGRTLVDSIMYMITSGVAHSVQFGMAAMMRASVEGRLDFVAQTREYERRTRAMKEIFLRNGFHIVYDRDPCGPTGDGFYFTVGYPGMESGELVRELMLYGISSISLATTGSDRQGVRACPSRMDDERRFELLRERLAAFRADRTRGGN